MGNISVSQDANAPRRMESSPVSKVWGKEPVMSVQKAAFLVEAERQ